MTGMPLPAAFLGHSLPAAERLTDPELHPRDAFPHYGVDKTVLVHS